MLILIKHEAKKYAYDTKSGAAVPLSSLQWRVAENIEPPIAPTCPTALRYQLAKYDSNDVKRAYDYLFRLFESKIINEESDLSFANLSFSGEYAIESAELAGAIISAVRERAGDVKIHILGESELSDQIKAQL